MIFLNNYQKDAVEEITDHVSKFLFINKGDKIVYFQAPTGAGKTITGSFSIERLGRFEKKRDICWLWVSPGKGGLHIQSYNSIKDIINKRFTCSLLENDFVGYRNIINKNEIVFLSWPRINRQKDGEYLNTVMKSGEKFSFLDVLKNTHKKGRLIGLIIDESHYAQNTIRTQELKEKFGAAFTIEMSATPDKELSELDRKMSFIEAVQVLPHRVVEEGMIKKKIIINHELSKYDEPDSFKKIMTAGIDRLRILNNSKEINYNIVGLIQLPNGTISKDLLKDVKNHLAFEGITEENGGLVVWLDEEKTPNVNLHKLNKSVKIVVFKQTIDLGWDCPRASVLIRLRDVKSEKFNTQTLGRILRMAERKHYKNEELNCAYVYTDKDNDDIKIDIDIFSKHLIFKDQQVSKLKDYNFIPLKYYVRKRIGRNSIQSKRRFFNIMNNIFCDRFKLNPYDNLPMHRESNLEKIKNQDYDLDDSCVKKNIPLEYQMDMKKGLEYYGNLTIGGNGERVSANLPDKYTQYLFIDKIKENLNGLAPYDSTKKSVVCIYEWFEKYIGKTPLEAQRIFINEDEFQLLFNKATEKHKEEQERIGNKIEVGPENWRPDKKLYFNEETSKEYPHYKKYSYEPCIIPEYEKKKRSESEITFEEEVLEERDSIKTWFKVKEGRGESGFGLEYINNKGEHKITYPDHIVLLNNNKQLIIEIKDSSSAENSDVPGKAKAIYNCVNKNPMLEGGIVIKHGNQWRINRNKNYKYDSKNMSEWEYLDDVLKEITEKKVDR